ncbi:MAG TPA: DUF4258 domain-containing protein [Phycisphaerae bacterium]|nr:DUF4258 domain-containing protein [Phycisphaerae bacterium]
MYEGWHIEFTDHARRRMLERLVKEGDVREAIRHPDSSQADARHGGRLLRRYLADWDRILVVAIEEQPAEGVVLVKTALWSPAKPNRC